MSIGTVEIKRAFESPNDGECPLRVFHDVVALDSTGTSFENPTFLVPAVLFDGRRKPTMAKELGISLKTLYNKLSQASELERSA